MGHGIDSRDFLLFVRAIIIGTITVSAIAFWTGRTFGLHILAWSAALYLANYLPYERGLRRGWPPLKRASITLFASSALILLIPVAFGFRAFGLPAVYAVLLILIVEFGRWFVDYFRRSTIRRLDLGRKVELEPRVDRSLQDYLAKQSGAYAAVPFGAVCAAIIATIAALSREEASRVALACMLGFLVVLELRALFDSMRHLARPMFDASRRGPVVIDAGENRPGKCGLTIRRRLLRKDELAPPQATTLDMACVSTDVRKVFLLSAGHNASICAVAMAGLFELWRSESNLVPLAIFTLALFLIVAQLPYVIGQSALHEQVLVGLEGAERENQKEELRKTVPLFPSLHVICALTASGTFGGLAICLADALLEKVF